MRRKPGRSSREGNEWARCGAGHVGKAGASLAPVSREQGKEAAGDAGLDAQERKKKKWSRPGLVRATQEGRRNRPSGLGLACAWQSSLLLGLLRPSSLVCYYGPPPGPIWAKF